jgi:hypothetical protein
MKTLTKLQLHELLKTKQAIAFLKDGQAVDITGDVALNWFDQIIETDDVGYVAETASYIWIAADEDEFREENTWQVGGTQ